MAAAESGSRFGIGAAGQGDNVVLPAKTDTSSEPKNLSRCRGGDQPTPGLFLD
ncbi:hypothetical protein MTY59_26390 [Mycobacterium senriense]|uniref:Uncharacterized protein n=1 Tax=Mycobacterium senriense TaxID=2775496 RepID=A0ABN6IHQ4_9MYCO|nr:hypothetical protein MTY59_26390 [Mycobacterium senriense]